MNTVCIATYNGKKYIAQQLQSILDQIATNDEVIVSDDGSTDGTPEYIQSLQDPRITILHSSAHYYKDNFLHALTHARGEYIFLSDQDDVWLPGKYEACVAELKQYDLVCHNCMLTDADLRVTNSNFFALYHSGKGIMKNILVTSYYGSCMAFRRSVLTYALPMPATREIGHDMWIGLVAEMTGRVKFIETPYILYRRHDSVFTHADSLWRRSNRPLYKKMWSRIVLLYHIIVYKIHHAR
ncbi:MAG: glycosyltransferase [Paludibacteraceae bacterium]|nr:glycosyltransferase [Paludibacteraceae bacterium]